MGDHRYWRILFSESNSTYITLSEVELRSSIGGSDQTGSGTASASSVYSESYLASNAFDNNESTQWTSSSGLPCWLQYDFGAGNEKDIVQYFLRVKTEHVDDAPTAWSLQYSDDSSAWTTVDIRSNYSWTPGLGRSLTVGAIIGCTVTSTMPRRDLEFGGGHQIVGTAQRLGANSRKRIRLHDRPTGMLIRETWSAMDGSFAFTYLKNAPESYIVMELDDLANDPWLDPACADRVTPEAMP